MDKKLITLIIIGFVTSLIAICPAISNDTISNVILVNGNESPTLSPGEEINFSWDNTSGCGNKNRNSNIILKVWKDGVNPYIDIYHNPTNPLIIENGYNLSGNYMIAVPWHKNPGNGCAKSNYTGYFTIEEPDEFECPGDGHGPYSGKTFATHITTLTVTAP